MTYTYHIQGGLGDFFCYMWNPQMQNHIIRDIPRLLVNEGNKIDLHIYSDNPDCFELFHHPRVKILPHLHAEYLNVKESPRCNATGSPDFTTTFGLGIRGRVKKHVAVIHPFTATPRKKWLQTSKEYEQLDKTIDILEEKGYLVFIVGRSIDALYFDPTAPISSHDALPSDFRERHPNVINMVDMYETGLALEVLPLLAQASVFFCIDSAYMMARWISPAQVISLLPDWYLADKNLFNSHYYVGLDRIPNQVFTYNSYNPIFLQELIPEVKK